MYWLIKGSVEVLYSGVGEGSAAAAARASHVLDGPTPDGGRDFTRDSSYHHDPSGGRTIAILNPGEYFGEIALLPLKGPGLGQNRRTATVRALKSYCDLQAVAKDDLLHCFTEFPEVEKEFLETANRRIQVLNEINKEGNESAVSSTAATAATTTNFSLFRPLRGNETVGTDMGAVISLQQGMKLQEEEEDGEGGGGGERDGSDGGSEASGRLRDNMEDVNAMLAEIEAAPQQHAALPAYASQYALEIAVQGVHQQQQLQPRRPSPPRRRGRTQRRRPPRRAARWSHR